MQTLFIIQLLISFFVGGGFVALLTVLAEKANTKVSGIILSFPSTALLGFFFLAWTQSPEEVASIVPTTFIPMGITVLFPVFYVYIARLGSVFIQKRLPLILFTFFVSVTIWLILALFVAKMQISNLLWGIAGYVILSLIAYFFLQKAGNQHQDSNVYNLWQVIGRAAFVGVVIVIIVVLGEIASPFWAGIFTMFPAALSSSLMIMHYYHGSDKLLSVFKAIPLGSLSIFVYAIVVMLSFPVVGFIWGTLIALLASLITSTLLTGKLHIFKQ